eukprot:scaffold6198_cov408-Prasinococcus_capsulatus_cf.AAC.4
MDDRIDISPLIIISPSVPCCSRWSRADKDTGPAWPGLARAAATWATNRRGAGYGLSRWTYPGQAGKGRRCHHKRARRGTGLTTGPRRAEGARQEPPPGRGCEETPAEGNSQPHTQLSVRPQRTHETTNICLGVSVSDPIAARLTAKRDTRRPADAASCDSPPVARLVTDRKLRQSPLRPPGFC